MSMGRGTAPMNVVSTVGTVGAVQHRPVVAAGTWEAQRAAAAAR